LYVDYRYTKNIKLPKNLKKFLAFYELKPYVLNFSPSEVFCSYILCSYKKERVPEIGIWKALNRRIK